MCSRFEMTAPPRDVFARFGLTLPPQPFPARPFSRNGPVIRPTDYALVILGTAKDGPAEGRWLRWGLPVDWDSRPLINARAETLARRPTFRPLLGSRILVPATAWYEWRKNGKIRRKNVLSPASGGIFAFAGLAQGEFFTIVTCAPAPAIAHIHDRMPVVLPQAGEAAWADPSLPFAAAAEWLKPFPDEIIAVEEEPSAAAQPDLFG